MPLEFSSVDQNKGGNRIPGGMDAPKRVESLLSQGLYVPNEEQFLHGVTEGKRLYGDIMAIFLHRLPQRFHAGIYTAMKPMNDDLLWLSAHISGLSAGLGAYEHEGGDIAQAYYQVARILRFSRGEEFSYNGRNYGIYHFRQPNGYKSATQNTFYLLYLIHQEDPTYLSFERLS